MATVTKTKSEILVLIGELQYIFSTDYSNKERLQELIKDTESVKSLFDKLYIVVEKYEKQYDDIDQKRNILVDLRTFKSLIEENVQSPSPTQELITIMEHYVSATRNNYKRIRNLVQTLDDINCKIATKIEQKRKYDIAELITRAVETKANRLISSDPNDLNNEERKLTIVKTFYVYFLTYASSIREQMDNNLDDAEFRLKLEKLQSKLLAAPPVDIKYYFSEMMNKLRDSRGYSTEILLKYFSDNQMVHISITNNSQFYRDKFIGVFDRLTHSTTKISDRRCLQSITTIIFQLNLENSNALYRAIFQDRSMIDLVFKLIYDKGAEIYLKERQIALEKTNNADNYFKLTTLEIMKKLEERFRDLFVLINKEKPEMFSYICNNIIDEKNSMSTYYLLCKLYGKRVECLDFSENSVDVKYCFNDYFFKSLEMLDIDDVPGIHLFCQFLFYIHAYNNRSAANNERGTIHNDPAIRESYNNQITKLRQNFLEVYDEDNRKYILDLTEILKIMINMETFDFRVTCCTSALTRFQSGDPSVKNVKSFILREFLGKNNNDETGEKDIYLRLAQSFNIDLLKTAVKDVRTIIPTLSKYNSNFGLYLKKLTNLQQSFNVEEDLTPGFSIPYYLSAKLLEDNNDIRTDENHQTAMAILFKVFNCSTADDKKVFLKQKDEIKSEFNKLFMSINCFTNFYDESENDTSQGPKTSVDDETNPCSDTLRDEGQMGDRTFRRMDNSPQAIILLEYDKKVKLRRIVRGMNLPETGQMNGIYQHLRDVSLSYILEGFGGSHSDSLRQRNEFARTIINHFIDYKLEHITKIVRSSSRDEVSKLLASIFEGRNQCSLNEWAEKTSKFGSRIYFLYCFYKYPETKFDEWFKEENGVGSYTSHQIIVGRRNAIKQEFFGNKEIYNKISISYLQHNQVGAIALIDDYLENRKYENHNLFFKVGTGQGKSLIIAEAARRIVQLNKKSGSRTQVFIITCYDHLAKRDSESHQKYYTHFGIQSFYCSAKSSTSDLVGKDVVYADLETYFRVLRKAGHDALFKKGTIKLPKIEDSVLIMDEFDSLILDSDEIFQNVGYFDLQNYKPDLRISDKNDIKKLFDSEFVKIIEHKFPRLLDRWCDHVLHKHREEHTTKSTLIHQSSLAKLSYLVNDWLGELLRSSKAYFIYYYLDPLVFYSKFNYIIGFSGSIKLSGMEKFNTLFENKISDYYDIPPFFGAQNLEHNRKCITKKVIEDREKYFAAIRTEIKQRYVDQPILIFADSMKKEDESESDFDRIYAGLLEDKREHLKDSIIILIKEENDINLDVVKNDDDASKIANIHRIGLRGSITLATRVIARGADIKVQKDIKQGLHLILTYFPDRENIYIQMLGRTARQDEKGSYSEITRTEKNFIQTIPVKVDKTMKIIHDTNEYFFKNIDLLSNKNSNPINWALFSQLIRHLSEAELKQADLTNFIKANFHTGS